MKHIKGRLNNKLITHAAYIQLTVGAVMISFAPVFVKLTSTSPTIDAFYRLLFGGTLLFLMALLRRDRLWCGWKALLFTAIAGLLFTLDLVFWHRSIDYIGPGLATIIVNLQAFMLAFIGIYFYGDRVNWKLIIAIPIALTGMYLLVGHGWSQLSGDYKTGVFLCFVAMFFYMFYILILRHSQTIPKSFSPIANIAFISFFGALFAGIIAYANHEPFFAATGEEWVWLLLYGIFSQAFGWLLIGTALPRVPLSIAGFLLLIQPSLAFIWDILFFKRVTSNVEIVGALVTLLAIYLSSTVKERA